MLVDVLEQGIKLKQMEEQEALEALPRYTAVEKFIAVEGDLLQMCAVRSIEQLLMVRRIVGTGVLRIKRAGPCSSFCAHCCPCTACKVIAWTPTFALQTPGD